ncbi:MAG: septation protein IspZ [Asticcacaulis sp.]|nr:septation protein IspZ [Asticcacaulis sp.]
MTDEKPPETLIETAIEADPDAGFPPKKAGQNYVKMTIDFGAPIAFGLTYLVAVKLFKFEDHNMPLLIATGVLVGASALALVAGFIFEKRVAWMPLIVGLFAMLFGGLTLYFHDTRFIKMKLTFLNLAFGIALLGGLVLKKQPLKALLAEALPLKEEAWPKLTLYYGLFFLAVGVTNEFVWRTQPEGYWVAFKSSLFLVTLAFSVLLTPFLLKNMNMPSKDESKAG